MNKISFSIKEKKTILEFNFFKEYSFFLENHFLCGVNLQIKKDIVEGIGLWIWSFDSEIERDEDLKIKKNIFFLLNKITSLIIKSNEGLFFKRSEVLIPILNEKENILNNLREELVDSIKRVPKIKIL